MGSKLTRQHHRVQSKIDEARRANVLDMKKAALDAIDESNRLIAMLIDEVEALNDEIRRKI
ncbi:hypothetical protein [Algicola sagamiensis]|uniref:hypothetical protein n=1 Tax=Algicola sagamiensis TaxID=163869 RepID=UPI0003606B4D|nr:hypothetical protein [Algicola sagamiensis]